MKLTDKAQQVAAEILAAFESGAVPKALAITFLAPNLASPSSRWSWRNRLLIALRGHADARGFRQWQEVGRQVRAGERALYILGPCRVPAERDEDLVLRRQLSADGRSRANIAPTALTTNASTGDAETRSRAGARLKNDLSALTGAA